MNLLGVTGTRVKSLRGVKVGWNESHAAVCGVKQLWSEVTPHTAGVKQRHSAACVVKQLWDE